MPNILHWPPSLIGLLTSVDIKQQKLTHSSVSVQRERFQENQLFFRHIVVSLLFLFTLENRTLCLLSRHNTGVLGRWGMGWDNKSYVQPKAHWPSVTTICSLIFCTSLQDNVNLIGVLSVNLCHYQLSLYRFLNQCGIYKVVKVVHTNWSDNHCNQSDTWPSILLLELY